ncbi:MAG: plastocyanin/azurin family copper-binding protein [Solirubrobacteraceae bacterium]
MRRTFIALALATAVFAGCGGDDDEQAAATPEATQEPAAAGGGGEAVQVSAPADGSLKFDQAELTAKAGEVTFTFSNPSSVPHALEIEGNGVEEETETITGSDAPLTVDLEPGTYTYYCPVGQHRSAGMEGTLTVE